MEILVLTRFGRKGANSRYRLLQFLPGWEQQGHKLTVQALLDDDYVAELYRTGRRPFVPLVRGYVRRMLLLPKMFRFDAVVCDQELLPYIPAFSERVVGRSHTRLIVDFDDAAYFKYRHIPLLRNKIGAIMASSDCVVLGNRHLAAYAARFTDRAVVIPTVVDTAAYKPKENYRSAAARIVWIGTPVTARFLTPLLPVFQRLRQLHPELQIRLIGIDRSPLVDGVNIETCPWSEQREAALIAECDLGVMPLPDAEFERGKCGLKLIQYMASGLPVVADPVGANCEIVEDGSTGFLPLTSEEWFQRLLLLVENENLRQRLGRRGRQRAEDHYSLPVASRQWQQILQLLSQPSGVISKFATNTAAAPGGSR